MPSLDHDSRSPERYERIARLFERARLLPRAERRALLDEVGAHDPRARGELEELLAAVADPGSPLAEERIARGRARLDRLAELGQADAPPADAPSQGGEPSLDSASALIGRLRERRSEGEPFRYRLAGEISRGGMGAILRAFDPDLRRTLAMKVALERGPAGSDARAQSVGRFLAEAQITGQLEHPGIVPVHELGIDAEGRVYFTMRLVRGDHLGVVFAKVRSGADGWSRTRALGVLLRVCEALAFAHDRGVIHRDLKPSNVMVGRFGEVYVMDWGLARLVGRAEPGAESAGAAAPPWTDREEELAREPGSPLLTAHGDVLGTPAYMAPEQARGELERLDPRSDVYALGAILYELLTGAAPYAPPGGGSSTPHVVLARALAGPPDPIAERARDVPPELVAICERAMARDPVERYADTGALAEELRAYLESRVVRAHRTGAVAELRKWIERNRAVAASLAALMLVAVAAAVLVLLAERRRTEGIRRFSDTALAQELLRAFEERGPIAPEGVAERERWLERAAELEERRPAHARELAALRARALPLDPAEAEALRATDPRTAERTRLATLHASWGQALEQSRAGLADPSADLARLEQLSSDVAAIELERPLVAGRVARLEAELAALRPWHFARPADEELHRSLAFQAERTERLFGPAGARETVRAELARIAELQAPDAARRAAWDEARAAIAASPLYDGYELAPQLDLAPLGPDPECGLWEFWHVLSGDAPERGPDGRWRIGAATGIVLVLVPGGEATIGAQASDPSAPHHDPAAKPSEAPPTRVTLAPWLLSKYELTQGQWARLTGEDPSGLFAGTHIRDHGAITRAHPVESLSLQAAAALRIWDLVLPTEAQWETAARAGTGTPYWFGARFDDGAFLVNHADRNATLVGLPGSSFDDGSPYHAPVDRTWPNPWGLHGMLGNVQEWCAGPFPNSWAEATLGGPDGRVTDSTNLVLAAYTRGGSFLYDGSSARVSFRVWNPPGFRSHSIGMRPSRLPKP